MSLHKSVVIIYLHKIPSILWSESLTLRNEGLVALPCTNRTVIHCQLKLLLQTVITKVDVVAMLKRLDVRRPSIWNSWHQHADENDTYYR